MNGERNRTLEAPPEDDDPSMRKRSRKRQAAVVEPAEAIRQPVPSAIAEEDETLYAQ